MTEERRMKSHISEFKSYEEEAEWWDTHDLTDLEAGEFKPMPGIEYDEALDALVIELDTSAKVVRTLNLDHWGCI